jgi:hypothetical protein
VGEGRTERYTVSEAADILGISPGAVRNRLSRGTLPKVKEGGVVYVLLPAGMSTDTPDDMSQSATGALISEMRSRIQFLEDELQRKDAILLNMTDAMKALSPPSQEGPPEAPESSEPATEGRSGTVAPQDPQEGAQRPWWRRMFGG